MIGSTADREARSFSACWCCSWGGASGVSMRPKIALWSDYGSPARKHWRSPYRRSTRSSIAYLSLSPLPRASSESAASISKSSIPAGCRMQAPARRERLPTRRQRGDPESSPRFRCRRAVPQRRARLRVQRRVSCHLRRQAPSRRKRRIRSPPSKCRRMRPPRRRSTSRATRLRPIHPPSPQQSPAP
jgi:hypothetical protein